MAFSGVSLVGSGRDLLPALSGDISRDPFFSSARLVKAFGGIKMQNCKRLDQSTSVCGYMKEYLPNGYAKLHYGGAIGEYKRNVRYVGNCRPGYQAREKSELETIVNVERDASAGCQIS